MFSYIVFSVSYQQILMNKKIGEDKHEVIFGSLNENTYLKRNQNFTFLLWILRVQFSVAWLFIFKASEFAQNIAFFLNSIFVF